jgi:hypothetical protein
MWEARWEGRKIKNREGFLMQVYKREEKIDKSKITNFWRCIF